MNNRVFLKIVLVVTCFAVIMAIGYPGMYGAWPSSSPSADSNAYVMPTPLPENSPNDMPQASPTPAFVVTPVPEEPEQMPTYFPAPGEEEYDPNLTPKENCEKNRNDDYNRCVKDLDNYPEMRKIDCLLSLEQNILKCSCVEPVAENDIRICRNNCTYGYANCALIASYRETDCRQGGKLSNKECDELKSEDLVRCDDELNLCNQPPLPLPPEFIATVEDTMSYRPPS